LDGVVVNLTAVGTPANTTAVHIGDSFVYEVAIDLVKI
jgi:hypothetical protein